MAEKKLDYSGTVCIMQPPSKLRDKQDEEASEANVQRPSPFVLSFSSFRSCLHRAK